MRAYSVFDDFPQEAIGLLEEKGVHISLLPMGSERPQGSGLREVIENYDIIILGTGQKLSEEMFLRVNEKKMIATASIGMDHICVPDEKKHLIEIINSPTANRLSVAEHTFAMILVLSKRILEGREIALQGGHKNMMTDRPTELYGKTIGVIGAGGTAEAVLEMAGLFGMHRLCWTRNPEKHSGLVKQGIVFSRLEELLKEADIISVNLPLAESTRQFISAEKISLLKKNAIFVSTSRVDVLDYKALIQRAKHESKFMVGLDVDIDQIHGLWYEEMYNVVVTPHIAGGTTESRKRMFLDLAQHIVNRV